VAEVRWPWSKAPPIPGIPPYHPPIVQEHAPKPDPGLIVEEIDTSAMTQTGVHRAWRRLSTAGDTQ
jgi:hypothetical protein